MDLNNVYIILARPDHSENIGAACRAMANNGISHLRIVGKRDDYDSEKVLRLALHADYIWNEVEFFESIVDATSDCSISAATTRRRGKKRKGKLYLPEEFSSILKNAGDGKIALVFGNERTGLTDKEVDLCTTAITIPSDENFPSLNLSHAVQILCYHLFREKTPDLKGYTPVDLSRLDKAVNVIANDLQKIGFFKVTGRPDMERFWRSVLSRAALSESECKYIEKVFNKAAGLIKK